MWNNFHRLNGQRKTALRGLTIDGKHVKDPTIIVEHFADYFHEISSSEAQQTCDRETSHTVSDETSYLNEDFSIQELFRAIDGAKGHSTGSDNM